MKLACGDVDKALAHAEEMLEGELHVEAQEHFYLEPQVTIAYPLEDGGLEVHCCTQALHMVQVRAVHISPHASGKGCSHFSIGFR